MTDATLHFLPWLRSGAAGSIPQADPLSGPLPAAAALQPWLRIDGHSDIAQPARLHGPGHVASLGAQVVRRVQPTPGAADVEPNYFAFVELAPADLPWRHTPATAGTAAGLRPWVVLVVVRQQEGVRVGAEAGASLPVLRIEPPAVASVELPDLADSAAWAHVQSTVAPADLVAALTVDPVAALARLLCPRRLLPRAAWHACLVPAFDVGVRAGLGADGSAAGQAGPAWDLADPALDQATVRLPVYHSWTFTTGPDGDFESLARRLAPDDADTVLGRVDLDLSHPGAPLPEPPGRDPVRADFVGGLKTPGVRRGGAPADYQDWLEPKLERLLERGSRRITVPAVTPPDYDPRRDDPVVAPPLYGSVQAGRSAVPDGTGPRAWLRSLGLTPELRAVAGLGAEVVRTHQESLLASAWAQAGAVRDAERALDRAHLAVAVGRSVARRVLTLDSGSLVQVTAPVQAWVAVTGSTAPLARELWDSKVPRGLVSAPFQRATRPRSGLGRLWRANLPLPADGSPGSPASVVALAPAVTSAFVAATSPAAATDLQVALEYAAFALPIGAWTDDPALDPEPARLALDRLRAARTPPTATVSALTRTVLGVHAPGGGRVRGRGGGRGGAGFDGTMAGVRGLADDLLAARPRRRLGAAREEGEPAVDLSTAADAVIAGMDPLPTVHSGLLARVPALSGLLAADGALPSRVLLQPVFTDPLYRDLVRLDPRYLLPGADLLANNRVAVLAADDDFVAAFLVGANFEMARELVWREFPTLPSYTFFHRFWDTGPGSPDDIGEIAGWTDPRLGGNLTGLAADALAVVLVRGDLVRRYPDAHVYLTRGRWPTTGAVVPDDTEVAEPVLQGALDRRSVFYGFAVSATDLRGDRTATVRTPETAGWYVTIEEPSAGPRFGLDAAADDGADLTGGAATWTDLSWGHLVPRNGTLGDVPHAVARQPLPPRTPATMDALTWGRNAAHQAAITWQRPYRVLIHADLLLPD